MPCALLKARGLRFLQITSRASCTALRPDQLGWSPLWKWSCKKRDCPWRQGRLRAELVWAEGGAVPQASSAAVLPWLRLMATGEGVSWGPEQPGQQHQGLCHLPQTQGRALNFNTCRSTALCFVQLILLEGSSYILLSGKSPEISWHVLITRLSLNILIRLQTGKLTERTRKHFQSALSLIWYKQLNESPKEAETVCYFNTQTRSDNSSKCLSF